jgi:Ca2+-binding EF-hand superfamily protein
MGQSDDVFKDMIKEMDIDGDGTISFQEFEQMMNQMIQTRS